MACTTGVKLEQFPAGLKVLVVDDDVTCLRVLEKMLQKCMYTVTICSEATTALNLLRERKGCFDVVLSDVHMPDMDGFRLLELIGLEMDLPVIMMSADDNTKLVIRGIRHGACDYLIKPIRDKESKNIWQHVVRKRRNENKEHDHSDSMEDHDRRKRAIDDVGYASPVNDGADEVNKAQKKRRDNDMDNDDSTTSKKPRVVWSVELHQLFVAAVNQLGVDKAAPKKILEIMNVPSLTKANVGSHLQKFRLYLKRLSGVAQQQGGPVENNLKLASLGRFDIQALPTSGQLPSQTLAGIDQRALLHASFQGSQCIQNAAYGQPLIRCPSNLAKQLSQPLMSNKDVHAEFAVPPYSFGAVVEYKQVSTPSEFGAASYVSSMSSCSRIVQDNACQRAPNMNFVQGSYNGKHDLGQVSTRDFVYFGKGTPTPNCLAVVKQELPMSNISQRKQFFNNNGNKVKQEPNMKNVKLGTLVQRLPPI